VISQKRAVELILHHPQFDPNKLVSLKDLLTQYIENHFDQIFDKFPGILGDEIFIAVVDTNYWEADPGETIEGKLIVRGREISNRELIPLLKKFKSDIFDGYKLFSVNGEVDNILGGNNSAGIMLNIISHLERNPETRTFDFILEGT
jgi:hypothetical protein